MYNQYERETIITTHDGLKTINVYTYQRKWMNKILLLKEKNPEEVNIIKQNEYMIEADLPAKYLKLIAPRKLTEEQRAEATARLAALRAKNVEISDEDDPDDDELSDSLITEAGDEEEEDDPIWPKT